MTPDGTVLATHRAARTIDAFSATAVEAEKMFTKLVDLEKRASSGDVAAKKELFRLKLDMGSYDLAGAKAMIAQLGLTAEELAAVQPKLASMETKDLLGSITSRQDTAGFERVANRFAEMAKAGTTPPKGDLQEFQGFWIILMDHYAAPKKDVALYETALGLLKKEFGENPRARAFFESKEKALEEMKEATKKGTE